jgi:propionyl-CoA synthetase
MMLPSIRRVLASHNVAKIARTLSTTIPTTDHHNNPDLFKFDRSTIQGPHGNYSEEYEFARDHPESFWAKQAQALDWHTFPQTILHQGHDINHYRWFPDGVINTSYNCLDVHVKNGRGEQVALIYDSPVTQTKQQFTYKELLHEVSTLAGALRDLGVEAGDRIVIYMPMIPQAMIAMLACARIGAIHR